MMSPILVTCRVQSSGKPRVAGGRGHSKKGPSRVASTSDGRRSPTGSSPRWSALPSTRSKRLCPTASPRATRPTSEPRRREWFAFASHSGAFYDEMGAWLERNPLATQEAKVDMARKLVDSMDNRAQSAGDQKEAQLYDQAAMLENWNETYAQDSGGASAAWLPANGPLPNGRLDFPGRTNHRASRRTGRAARGAAGPDEADGSPEALVATLYCRSRGRGPASGPPRAFERVGLPCPTRPALVRPSRYPTIATLQPFGQRHYALLLP
jgi:hypothetical protein